jgi:hypothetical protein
VAFDERSAAAGGALAGPGSAGVCGAAPRVRWFTLQKLMQHLSNAKTGKRVLLAGRLVTKRGQRLQKCLTLAERAFIRYFLSEGHDLVNKQGTRLRRHEVESSGCHPKRYFPRQMHVEKGKGE